MIIKLFDFLQSLLPDWLRGDTEPIYNEYWVEFQKGEDYYCQFGVMAVDPKEAVEMVERDTGGVVTKIAIRAPEDQDGMPVYYIVPQGL